MNTPADTATPVQAAKWAQEAQEANHAVQLARALLATGQPAAEGRDVETLLFDAQEATERLRRSTRRAAGFHAPVLEGAKPVALHLLDTTSARRLLALLDEAQAVAEQVDAERGRALPADTPLLPGESRGTDLAETISEIALRVRGEVQGPKGRD